MVGKRPGHDAKLPHIIQTKGSSVSDREWKDGDDSEMYDDGYDQGVKDAYDYVIKELGLNIKDSDLLKALGVSGK